MVKNKKAGSFFKEPAAVINNKLYPFLFLFNTFSAASIISGTSNPYFFNSSLGVPLSPNVSCVPTYSIGVGIYFAATWAIASPNPPIILCSSAVTAHFVFFKRTNHCFLINGFYCMNIYYLTLDPFFL